MGNKVDNSYFDDMGGLRVESVDLILAGDEKIVWRGTPKKNAYVYASILRMLPIAIFWAAVDITMLVVMSFEGILEEFWYFLVPFFLIHLAPVWIWLGSIVKANIEHKNIEYALTDSRVIIKKGVFGISYTSVPLSEISAVNVRVGAIDKMIGVGDIYLSGKQKAVIFDVYEPYQLCTTIQERINEVKQPVE